MSRNAHAEKLITEIAPLIKAEAAKRGYLSCAAVIAQAIKESVKTSGLSTLAAKYHNYFGMKCGSSWKGKSVNLKTQEEYSKGVLTPIKDNFRVYDSMEAGVKGYFDFINTSRYSNLKNAKDYKQYAELVKKDGWATDYSYTKGLCNIVELYGLTKYDNEQHPTLRKGHRGVFVAEMQRLLNRSDTYSNLNVDGVFGTLTESVLIRYQGEHGLVKDGVCGARTWAKLLEVK